MQIEIAQQCFMRGALDEAVAALGKATAAERARPDVLLFWGVCLARLRRPDEALTYFAQVLAVDPDCYEAITWMAVLKKNRREVDEAIRYAERAIQLQPKDSAGYGVLGGCFLYSRQHEHAIAAFEKAVQLAPASAEHHHNLGLALVMAHRQREAAEQLRRAIELAPRSPQSYLALASEFAKYGMVDKALDCLSEGLRQIPRSAPLNSAIASAFTMLRNDQAAEVHHRRALEISPQEAKAPFATWLLNQGRFEEASKIYEDMLAENRESGVVYYGLTQCRKFTAEDDELVQRMEELLDDPGQSVISELHLRYGLGKVNEGRGRFEEAMTDYNVANDLAHQIHNPEPYEGSPEHGLVTSLHERLVERGATGIASEVPIFIIGMIRSGTTLLDQILSSHPSVDAAGELQFWTEETLRMASFDAGNDDSHLKQLAEEYVSYIELLAGKSERITDKMPLNFAYAGVIHRALPNARFIHIRRNPVDTCLSIYTTYFGQGPSFAYSKSNIVAYYLEYRRMMEYWRERLPNDRLMEIDYEELIASPETLIPKIVNFCGLRWDEACLHHDRNESAINTPSRWQARQPIYKSSMERWRKFEPWLGEFSELLTN